MANLFCSACKQHKKEENFSMESLQKTNPTCSHCDTVALLQRVEATRHTIEKAKKQQQLIISTSAKIENTNKVKKNKPATSFLKSILAT